MIPLKTINFNHMKFRLLLTLVIILLISCNKNPENIPLPEHPRPDFERSVWQNLNGYWQFQPDSLDAGLAGNWQNRAESFDQQILVPFSWASPLSEVQLPDVHIGWYYRTFTINNPKKWSGTDMWLVFCASDFNTTVWINGIEAGSHSGGYVPFSFNISKMLKEGENKIVVRVEDKELDNRPSGKQYYGNAKGIWQTVYLEARPENHISNVKFTPDIDNQIVKVEVALAKRSTNPLTFSISGKNNDINFQNTIPTDMPTAEFTVPVKNLKLWHPDDPFLYEIAITLSDENIADELSTYFGMRKISAVDIPGKNFKYVALNNKPVYLKLALDQSYHPEGFYTFPSDKFMKEEILRAKDLGLNGLRIHIKSEIPRKLYWADKLGLLIQSDIPNYWGEPDSIARANWEYIAEEQVKRDYNHPSIFSWVLFNETWGLFTRDTVTGKRNYLPETREWVKEWYYRIKEYDPVRLVEDNSPCNWDHVITDINTWHRYSPARHWSGFLDMVVKNTYPGSGFNFTGGNVQGDQPMFNSECGAVWGYSGSTGDIDITWEYHIMMNEFRKRPKIAGFLFTEFHDVINEWNGYYRFDRTEKIFGLDELCPGMTMKDFHTDLYIVAGKDFYQTYKGGTKFKMPLGISAVTGDIPEILTVRYSIYGWDCVGKKFEHASGSVVTKAEPFTFKELSPIEITAPERSSVMIFSVMLEDENGTILHRNFVPFKVDGNPDNKDQIITVSPENYTDSSWSIKQHSPQNGNKTWGMGSGYFEYQFELPGHLSAEEVKSIEFRAELASRFPQSKYLEEGDAEKIGMTVVTEKGIDPGYGKNSYPQTDTYQHRSLVKITANDQLIAEVELPDDPADHRGILSWMNQQPGWEWGSSDQSIPWELDEAGSYGFLVKATLDLIAEKSALETGKVVIRLLVDETSSNRGGLSVYGKESGRFPMDLTLLIRKGNA
jgi:hypothetical protein